MGDPGVPNADGWRELCCLRSGWPCTRSVDAVNNLCPCKNCRYARKAKKAAEKMIVLHKKVKLESIWSTWVRDPTQP